MTTELIHTFYRAFAARDADEMASCYHDDIRFSDPVFPALEGDAAGNMWRMLCENGKDLRIEHSEVVVDGDHGAARWEAHYTFSATGRRVHNIVHASFRFRDGKIVEHTDRFDFYRWTRQALGVPGVLLGWSPILQNKVRRTAAGSLRHWSKKRAS